MFIAKRTTRFVKRRHVCSDDNSYGAWLGIRGGRGYKHGAPSGATLGGRRRALAQHHPETRDRARFGLRPSDFNLLSAFGLRASGFGFDCRLSASFNYHFVALVALLSTIPKPETERDSAFFRPSGFGFDPRGPRSAGRLRSSLTSPRLLRFARSAH